MARKYLLTTLGCKVNQYETQQIRELFDSLGMVPARDGETPDIAVVNTCAVTSSASRKSGQALRRLARRGATSIVAVGCGATDDAERLRRLPHVLAVLGHDTDIHAELRELLTLRERRNPHAPAGDTSGYLRADQERADADRNEVWMNPFVSETNPRGVSASQAAVLPAERIVSRPLPIVKEDGVLSGRIDAFAGHQRAFLKVQDGCDAWCSYCVIPRLRPSLRSKPVDVAVAEAQSLVRAGHKELIVTGIFLGAYGRETAIRKRFSPQASPLAQLIQALARVEGLARLRLSSLEPGDVDAALLDVLAGQAACVPHLHLPLQSGSGEVLRRMNRQYTREAFVEMIERVRSALDRPAISTDIIVGFPGETEADFEATLDVARAAGFVKIHAFPFSPRERTAAAKWRKDFIHGDVVRDRLRRLGELERESSLAYRRVFLGEHHRVLVETTTGAGGSSVIGTVQRGRTDRYFEVHFEATAVRPGDLVTVRIDRVTPGRTHGTYMEPGAAGYPLHVLSA